MPYSTTTYDATLSRQAHPFERSAGRRRAATTSTWCASTPTARRGSRATSARGSSRAATPPATGSGRSSSFREPCTPRSTSSTRSGRRPISSPTAMRAAGERAGVHRSAAGAGAADLAGDHPRRTRPARPVHVPLRCSTSSASSSARTRSALIEAFTQAFAPGEGPVLVLKTINGDLRLTELERLRAAAPGGPTSGSSTATTRPKRRTRCVGLSDCYVSLHRSEGLGLTMAEAMALGKPVIATGVLRQPALHDAGEQLSGRLHARRVPAGCAPYPAGARWADPDLGQAAGFMREVYERPEDAARRASRGRADILEHHSVKTSAAAVAARVDEIRRARARHVIMPGTEGPIAMRPSKPPAAGAGGSAVEPLEQLLPQLDELANLRVNAGGSSFLGIRQAAQRLLFRLLRPYAFQQRQLQQQLIAALRHAATAIRQEQRTRETLDARVRELTRELLASKRELRRLEGERG